MIKRLAWVAVAAGGIALAAAAFAPATSAQEGTDNDVLLAGRGVLTAHGSGVAAVRGRMHMHVEANRGVLLVRDIAGDAVVRVDGNGETASWHGFTAYFGAGRAHIVGSHVAVIVVGQDIDLGVAGKGWAYLKGQGTFSVNGHGPFPWQPNGGFAGVDDGGAEPSPGS